MVTDSKQRNSRKRQRQTVFIRTAAVLIITECIEYLDRLSPLRADRGPNTPRVAVAHSFPGSAIGRLGADPKDIYG